MTGATFQRRQIPEQDVVSPPPQDVNYAVKGSFATAFLESAPKVAAKLKDPNARTKSRKFSDVAKEVQAAAVLILMQPV